MKPVSSTARCTLPAAVRITAPWLVALGVIACGNATRGDGWGDHGGASATEGGSASGPSSSAGSAESGGGPGGGGDEDGLRYDVGPGGGSGPGDGQNCKVNDGMDAVGDCTDRAPPNSFEPDIQWSWTGPNGERESAVTPLVINLTDDNGDGEIDLCDTPDVVVVATSNFYGPAGTGGHIYVLDGATGTEHFRIETAVDPTVTPAIGDIDGDGLPEIVTAVTEAAGFTDRLVAFEHDGTLKWRASATWAYTEAVYGAIALADLDNDGTVEIIAGTQVYDHKGELLWKAPTSFTLGTGSATTAADLDGDGDLEVVLGHAAYHHDGSQYYLANGVGAGYPQIGNLDGDPEPEILLMNTNGITVLEHDGRVKFRDLTPTGDPPSGANWIRPAAIHDMDGDGVSDFVVSSVNNYTAYKADASIIWKATVRDESGIAAGTAFDFLGDGIAEAMYADEYTFFIFDGNGMPYLQVPRSSGTIIEYPVVADIDNDGSAEILVVSMSGPGGQQTAPTLQAIRDEQDRWIQARRIWNQHTYHVTNVREDGTIPQFEPPSWKALNTFRTNAQIQDGGICQPPVG